MSRGVGWAALATVILGLTGVVFWLGGGDDPVASDPHALVTPTTAPGAPTTQLPTGAAEQPAQPLRAGPPDAAPADAVSAPGGADGAIHPRPFQTLSLSGRIVDARALPLPGAEVILNPSRQGRQQHGFPENYVMEEPAWDEYPQASSAADGTFAFTAQEAGMVDGSRMPIPNSHDGATTLVARLSGYVPAAVLVPADSWTVPMGDIVLEGAGIVSGRVVDSSSRPVPDLRIAIGHYGRHDDGRDKPSWGLVSSLIEAHSQPDGRFLLDTLDPGRYRLEVVGEGYQAHSFEVEVAAGQTLDVGDLVIQPGRILAGRVVDENGVGLAGATLKARPSTLLNLEPGEDTALRDIKVTVISSSGDREVTAESGPDGVFRFSDLVDKEYVLLAKQDHREPIALRKLRPDRLDLELVLASEALMVLRVVDQETKLPVECSVSIRRLSSADATEPGVMDPFLTMLEHAVAAERLGLDGNGVGLYVAGPAGFVGHHLSITSDDYAPLQAQLPGLQPGEIHEQTFELSRASTISGRVTDPEGVPLASADISVLAVEPDPDEQPARLRGVSADDGTYTVGGLSEGQWTVQAKLEGYVLMEPVPVTLGVAQQLQDVGLTLQLGARISGTVSTPDGLPAPAHFVQIWTLDDEGQLERSSDTRTGADGRYLFSGLPDGPLTLTAEPGARAEVFARRSAESQVDLALRRPARLSGRVTDASGVPVSCEVRYRADVDEWQTAETRSNQQGEYVLDDLPPGDGLVYATLDRTRTPIAAVQLDYGRTEVRDLAFGGGRITGLVILDDTGETLAGVRVRAIERIEGKQSRPRGIGGMQSRGVTGEGGRFELVSLEPGRYRLVLSSSEYVPLQSGSEVVNLEGASANHDLRVTYAATLRGRTSTVGEPEDGNLSLHLTRIEDGLERFVGVPFEGDYELKGISAGDYRYEVKRNGHWPPFPDQDHVFATGQLTMASGQTTLHDIVLLPAADH